MITSHSPNHSDIPPKILEWINQAHRLDDPPTLVYAFYGEYTLFENEEELDKAMQYLELWKHFMVKKMKGMMRDEKRIYRPPFLLQLPTIGIKLGFLQEGRSSSSPKSIEST